MSETLKILRDQVRIIAHDEEGLSLLREREIDALELLVRIGQLDPLMREVVRRVIAFRRKSGARKSRGRNP